MKKIFYLILTVLLAAQYANAQVTVPGTPVTPQVSTADNPKWYLMMVTTTEEPNPENRYRRFLQWNGTKLRTEQFVNGMPATQITDNYKWCLEDAGDGNVYLRNAANNQRITVPASITGNNGNNTPLVMSEEGSKFRWGLSKDESNAPENCVEKQYIFANTGSTSSNAYINAMGAGNNDFGLTIWSGGINSASGWFFYEPYPAMTRKYDGANQQNRYLDKVTYTVQGEEHVVFEAKSESELPYTEMPTPVTTATSVGALIDKTSNKIVLPAGTTSFDMNFRQWNQNISDYEPQIKYTTQAYYIDFNQDFKFEGATDGINEISGGEWGGQSFDNENGWTRKITLPANLKNGTYRMRVIYHQPNNEPDWTTEMFTKENSGEIRNGIAYDFDIVIEEEIQIEYTVTLNKPNNGNLSVTYNNGSKDVTVSTDGVNEAQTFNVAENTKLTVTVTPDNGYQLESLSPDMTKTSDAENVYEFTVTEAVTISAIFEQEQGTYYTVTIDVTKPEQGSVKVEMTENGETKNVVNGDKVKENTELTITPEAKNGYDFLTLLIDNKPVQLTDGSYKLIVTKDVKISPKFKKQVSSFEVSWIEPENGKLNIYKTSDLNTPLTQKSTIEVGTELKIAIEANEGYDLSRVYYKYFPTERTVDIVKEDNEYIFTVAIDDENPTNNIIYIYSEFEAKTFNFTKSITPIEGGTVSVKINNNEVTENVKYDDIITIQATPNKGYGIKDIEVIGATKIDGKENQYQVKGDVKLNVTFEEIEYSVIWNNESIENGIISKVYDDGKEIESGDKVVVESQIKVEVEPKEGYELSKLYYQYAKISSEIRINNSENGYVFTLKDDGDKSKREINILAKFEPKTFSLATEVITEEGGSVYVTVDGESVEKTVKYEDIITVTVNVNEGYLLESLVVEGAEEVEGQKDQYTVTGNVTITATFTKDTSSINSTENRTVYYNSVEEILYTGAAKSVRVYDLSGKLVLNAENQDNVSLAELADGIYTVTIDNITIKLNK